MFNRVLVCSIALIAFVVMSTIGDAAGWRRGTTYQRVCANVVCKMVPVAEQPQVVVQPVQQPKSFVFQQASLSSQSAAQQAATPFVFASAGNCACGPNCPCAANAAYGQAEFGQVSYGGPVRAAIGAPIRAVGAVIANGVHRRQSRREARGGMFGGFFRGARGGCGSCG